MATEMYMRLLDIVKYLIYVAMMPWTARSPKAGSQYGYIRLENS